MYQDTTVTPEDLCKCLYLSKDLKFYREGEVGAGVGVRNQSKHSLNGEDIVSTIPHSEHQDYGLCLNL